MLKIRINQQLSLSLEPRSPLASLARLSTHELLRQVAEQVARAQARSSPLSDWFERAVDQSDATAITDTDELFVAYFNYCLAVGVPRESRLTFAAFGRALRDRGLTGERDHLGRSLRRGCRLMRLFPDPKPLVPAIDIERFLGAMCLSFGEGADKTETVRAGVLYRVYCAWADAEDLPRASIKQLARAMLAAGFIRKRSNGLHWCRVQLRAAVAQAHDPRAPVASVDVPSGLGAPAVPSNLEEIGNLISDGCGGLGSADFCPELGAAEGRNAK